MKPWSCGTDVESVRKEARKGEKKTGPFNCSFEANRTRGSTNTVGQSLDGGIVMEMHTRPLLQKKKWFLDELRSQEHQNYVIRCSGTENATRTPLPR
jgi:hypothetical protein